MSEAKASLLFEQLNGKGMGMVLVHLGSNNKYYHKLGFLKAMDIYFFQFWKSKNRMPAWLGEKPIFAS